MSKSKIIPVNCIGLAATQKRLNLFKKGNEENYDFILLQDIHLSTKTLTRVKTNGNGNLKKLLVIIIKCMRNSNFDKKKLT